MQEFVKGSLPIPPGSTIDYVVFDDKPPKRP